MSALRALAAAAVAALALPALALGAVELRNVDASSYPTIRATIVSSEPTSVPPVVEEDGTPVKGLEATNLGKTKSVVLAIDRSRSMKDGALEDAIAAARSFIDDKAQGDRIAIVTFGSQALDVTRFSSATIDSDVALRNVLIDDVQGTALHDAVVRGARLLEAEPVSGRVIVLLTDGRDVSSAATLEDAIEAARGASASVYPIAIESKQFSPGPLQRLARATGGTYYGVASTSALAAVYTKIAKELRRTWQISYATAARPGDRLDLEVSVPGAGAAKADLAMPGDPTAAERTTPKPIGIIPAGIYRSGWGWLAIALAVGALIAAAVAISLRTPKGTWLKGRLAPYTGPERQEGLRAAFGPKERLGAFRRLFAITERVFGQLRLWRRLEVVLRRADLPLRTVEAAYIILGSGLVVGMITLAAGAPFFIALVMFCGGAFAPFAVFSFKAKRRTRAFDDQLPDLLLTVSASLKAGHSFKQSLQTIVDEAPEPAAKEFGRALNDAKLGRPVEEALEEIVDRVGSDDLAFVVDSVSVQTQVGGSLAGLFDMVADTVRQRQQFMRKVRGLTAMGRMSAYVLVALPFALALLLTAINPVYMKPLYETGTGHMLIGIALGMMAVGALILRKMVDIRG